MAKLDVVFMLLSSCLEASMVEVVRDEWCLIRFFNLRSSVTTYAQDSIPDASDIPLEYGYVTYLSLWRVKIIPTYQQKSF